MFRGLGLEGWYPGSLSSAGHMLMLSPCKVSVGGFTKMEGLLTARRAEHPAEAHDAHLWRAILPC